MILYSDKLTGIRISRRMRKIEKLILDQRYNKISGITFQAV